MRRSRRTFSAEFKAEAVKLITERRYSITQACKELEEDKEILKKATAILMSLESNDTKRSKNTPHLRLKSSSFLRQAVNPPASEPFNQV